MKKIVNRLWKGRGHRGIAIVLLLALVFGTLPEGVLPDEVVSTAEAAEGDEPQNPLDFSNCYVLCDSGQTITNQANAPYRMSHRHGYLTFYNDATKDAAVSWLISGNEGEIVDVKARTDGDDKYITENGTVSGPAIDLVAKRAGTVNATIIVTYDNKDTVAITIRIEVGFYIDRTLYQDPDNGVWMQDLMASDDNESSNEDSSKYSIIMNQGAEWELGNGEDENDQGKLRLVCGSAEQDVTWVPGNENVAKIEEKNGKKKLVAVGGGRTILTAIPKKTDFFGDNSNPDSIEVYVNPKVTVADIKGNPHEYLGATTSAAVTIDGRTEISIPLEFNPNDSNDTIAARIYWVVERRTGGGVYDFLCDSFGNKPSNASNIEMVEMKWNDNKKAFDFSGKAGQYKISFYPGGDSYKPNSRNPKESERSLRACTSMIVDVNSTFYDRTVRLNVHGKYDLSAALNIPLDILLHEFEIAGSGSSNFVVLDEHGNQMTSEPWGNYIDYDRTKAIITAKQVGQLVFTVQQKSGAATYIPGLPVSGGGITITLIIGDSFSLTSSNTTMAVGQEMDIYGMLGSGDFPDGSTFAWHIIGDGGKYIQMLDDGNAFSVKIRATAPTPPRVRAELVLEWTDPLTGITQVASCFITVINSTTPIKLDHDELLLQSDDKAGVALTVTNFVEGTNLVWISSDESIIKVVPDEDYKSMARVIPQGKTGIAYVTVLNKDNNQIAVCRVVVNQYMTELKIDKGEYYTAKLVDGKVYMKATYSPRNATSTEVKWTSTNPEVATVEYNGLECTVTLKKAGTAIIRVASSNQPAAYSVYAECILTVETVPLTNIAIKESNLTMVAGDTYKIEPTLTPANASDKTLTWQTGNANIAKVDKDGVITAVSVGVTTITVSGGEARPVSIVVNVLNKLNNINFKETELTIEVGETHDLEVVYAPDADINKNITFTSTNPSIVTVDEKGTITGVKEGLVMIIATAEELGTTGAITCMVHVVPQTIYVQDFSISPDKMNLIVGQEEQIKANYKPADTTNQEVKYTSGNPSVATVTEDGLVKGVQPGFTIITCEDVKSGKTAVCLVSVESGVVFSLSPATRELVVGRSFTLKKVTDPTDAKKTAKWKSSNTKIAVVNSKGKVTGKKIGSCTITCTLTYYGVSATCRVKVAKLKSSLKLDKTSIRMNLGSTYTLKKTVTSNDNKLPSVEFTSKNSKIASVGSKSGKIRARNLGSTYITAKTKDAVHATARCRVTVIRRATSISLNKTYAVCYVGSTLTLSAKVKPSNASIKKVSWSSSDRSIAAVTPSGKVTGYAEGETYITASTTDGSNKKARCLVKVMDPIATSSILVAQRDLTMKVGDVTTLSYTVLPNDHTDSIKMASDNKRVVTVTNSGKVTAVGPGNATITLTASSGVTATVNINVVQLNKSSITMRQYDTETLIVHGAVGSVTWYSGNNSIATVTNGKVVGRGIGTTYIYAYIDGCKMSCRVTITSVK